MLEIINKIGEDPASYADVIEDQIKNIMEEQYENDENKIKLINKKEVKAALNRSEPSFR
jgi:hypothetical protein